MGTRIPRSILVYEEVTFTLPWIRVFFRIFLKIYRFLCLELVFTSYTTTSQCFVILKFSIVSHLK